MLPPVAAGCRRMPKNLRKCRWKPDKNRTRNGGAAVSRLPLAIDLFCGLGGWADGLLAAGWRVVGFDIERHVTRDGRGYPGELVIQDIRMLHGWQFQDARLIVASPPCQAYSYMAMPFSRGKRMADEMRRCFGKRVKLTELFRH